MLKDREGSNAGRGFRYQDAVAGLQVVASWAGEAAPALVIPEGGDDVERREEHGAALVQVKSRREHLGPLGLADAAKHVAELWGRAGRIYGEPFAYELVVERGVARCGELTVSGLPDPLVRVLAEDPRAGPLLPRTRLVVAQAPREDAIRLVAGRAGCSPLAAELCVARIVARIGDLADANGRRTPASYCGLSTADVVAIVADTLIATDPEALERAVREGACEPVDFLTPLDEPDFHLGIDVQPGHVAAGLVAERPTAREAVAEALQRRPVVVAGPSGAGKSALMWDAAHALRHVVRWYRLRRVDERDVPSIVQLLRALRTAPGSPVGLVVDDVGRRGVEGWSALVRELATMPGALLLGSIREEDLFLVADRARQAEIRVEPDAGLAERLWTELRTRRLTEWPGWREPWERSRGLTLEYVHILTAGRRFEEVLADQVADRERDPKREMELNVLRIVACATAAGASVEASELPGVVGASEAAVSRALRRLVDEHLVRPVGPGRLAGLHQLRSAELFRLTHAVPPPEPGATLLRAIACVPDEDLEPLLSDAISRDPAGTDAIIAAVGARIAARPTTVALSAALRGVGAGQIRLGVDAWLARPATITLPRTQIGTAAMFGTPGLKTPDLPSLKQVEAAAAELRAIRMDPARDLRRILVGALPARVLPALVAGARSAVDLELLLATLIGGGWSDPVAAALRERGPVGLDGELGSVAALLGTLAALDRELACEWAHEVGFDALPGRLPREMPWASVPILETTPEGVVIRCDYWLVADGIQADAHGDVVRICETVLGLWPAADLAASDALAANGMPAGSSVLDLATKRIPRENLPPASVPRWNRQWNEAIALRVATPSYTGYLAEAVAILDELAPLLERTFDSILKRRRITPDQEARLASLYDRAVALTPPVQSPLEASGAGSDEPNRNVTRLQNLVFSGTANVVRRFAPLPEGAGAYISWLNDLIGDCDRARDEEPWALLGAPVPASLDRIRRVLIAARALAGESHMRAERPVDTWREAARRARPNNAPAACAAFARSSSDQRRRATREAARHALLDAGVEVELHLVDDPDGILPWPPYEALALVPGGDMVGALAALASAAPAVRAEVDGFARVTVVPTVGGLALPQFALSGQETLLPLPDRACGLLDRVGVPRLASPLTDAFNLAMANAGWLASMDALDLGVAHRPLAEAEARTALEAALRDALDDVERRAEVIAPELGSMLASHVARARSGALNLAAAAYDVLHGSELETADEIAAPTLAALDAELRVASDPTSGAGGT